MDGFGRADGPIGEEEGPDGGEDGVGHGNATVDCQIESDVGAGLDGGKGGRRGRRSTGQAR